MLLALAWGLRGWRLSQPDEVYFDEQHYVPAALTIMTGRPDTNANVPPLGKLLMAASVRIWLTLENVVRGSHDYTATCLTWRADGCLFGMLMIPLLYFLGKSMFGRSAALLAAFLLDIDFLHIVCSRIGLLDIYLAFFVLLALYCTWEYIEAPADEEKPWLIMASIAVALGTATKWSCLFFVVGALPVVALLKQSWRDLEPAMRWRRLAQTLAIGTCILAVLYLVSSVPRLRHHHYDIIATIGAMAHSAKRMVMFRYSNHFEHPYRSPWWQWPTLLRPCWLYFHMQAPAGGPPSPVAGEVDITEQSGPIAGIVAIGSPWVWWTFLAVLAGMIVFLARRLRQQNPATFTRDERALVLLTATYLSQLLLWSINRGFFYYMLPLTPMMCLLLGWLGAQASETWRGRGLLTAWVVGAMGCLFTFWPILVAWPIPAQRFLKLMWLPHHWL